MTHEQRFRSLCRNLMRRGIKPTPTILNIYLGRYIPDTWGNRLEQGMSTRQKPNSINGREAKWRREELVAAGWTEPYWSGAWNITPSGAIPLATSGKWSPPR